LEFESPPCDHYFLYTCRSIQAPEVIALGRKERYKKLADKFLPTMKRICAEEDTPFQVCFAQLLVESGGRGELGKRHNYFGLKYPRGKYAKVLWERLGKPGKHVKMTPERLKVRDRNHLDKLLKKGAVFSDKFMKSPYYGKSVRLKMPCAFCTFPDMEAGIRAWCIWMKRSRYKDGGIFATDPVRWIAYRWLRGYATANAYVEAVVKRMNSVAKYLGLEEFRVSIDDDLDELLDEARELGPGRDRWDLGKEALEANGLTGVPYEVIEFEEMEIVVDLNEVG